MIRIRIVVRDLAAPGGQNLAGLELEAQSELSGWVVEPMEVVRALSERSFGEGVALQQWLDSFALPLGRVIFRFGVNDCEVVSL